MTNPKPLTEKDVRYAVEFGHEKLVRSYDEARRPATQFHLQPSGLRVDPSVANRITIREQKDD